MLIFWIGTVAELIKVFTVISEARERKIPYIVVATGQNRVTDTDVLKSCNDNKVDILLSDTSKIKKSTSGLLTWFVKTYSGATKKIRKYIDENNCDIKNATMIVHGDTVSTLMGALVAKKIKVKLAHVEAGLRSFDLLHPFPEEIDRVLTSKRVDVHFCPSDIAEKNLIKANVHGKIVNTKGNTIYDGLQYANTIEFSSDLKCKFGSIKSGYFVFVMHRQENVANVQLFAETVKRVCEISEKLHCVCVLHEITRIALENNGLMPLVQNKNFTLLPRVEYFDFMKVLQGAEYVITDGGSNQEELAYMGKPTLIMRTKTERQDGIGKNAIMCNNDFSVFNDFVLNYKSYLKEAVILSKRPSDIIVDNLI